jgi:hypothetical protein
MISMFLFEALPIIIIITTTNTGGKGEGNTYRWHYSTMILLLVARLSVSRLCH